MRRTARFVWLIAGVLPLVGSLQNSQAEEPSRTEGRAANERRRGPQGTREGKPGMRGGPAALALQLKDITPEQKFRLEAIQKEARLKRQQMQPTAGQTMVPGRADRIAQRDQQKKMMAGELAKVEAVLTEAQKQELRQKLLQMRGARQTGKRGGPQQGKQ